MRDSEKTHTLSDDFDSKPFVSIVVLNHNGKERVKECFRSILNMDYSNYEVIFVDNASSDGSLEFVKQLANGSSVSCSFIEMGYNSGYSRGKNAGVSASKGEYVWLLDNDIKPDPDCLEKLVEFMAEYPEVALCGPVLLDHANRNKVAGGGYIMSLFRQPRPYLDVLGKTSGYHYVSYISGSVIFVRKKVWDQLRGFEGSGMFFLDDNDFGPRCWIAGWKVAVLFNCFAMHFQQNNSSHKYWRWRFRQFAPGTVRGMIRNYSSGSIILAMPVFLLYTLLKSFKNTICRFDPRIILDCFISLFEAAKGLPESFRQRRNVQRMRVIDGDPFLKL